MIAPEMGAVVFAPRLSLSPLTVFEIRHGVCRATESNACRFRRLCLTYAIDETSMRLLMGVGDAYIDTVGRIRE